MQPTVSVLIPAHNEAETIGELVQACLDQPYPIEQLIVVADSCKDNTAEVARQAGATLVLETTFADKAANQNHALPHITGDVIVGFDGDSKPEPDCISRMVADIARGYDATCSSILPLQETGFFIEARRFAYSLGSQWWRICQRTVGRLQVLTGASYAFRTDVVRAVGGFPNGLISADMDITWKLHEGGYKTWYTADALTLTVDPENWHEYTQQMPRWAAGYFQNVARYKRLMWNWRSLLTVGTAMFDLVTLWWWLAVVIYNLVTWQHLSMFRYMGYWAAGHTALTTYLVSRVVGWKKAALGFLPYTLLNFYNKYLYTKSMFREWLLGRHYAAWTGRSGRKTVITPMTMSRRWALGQTGAVLGAVGTLIGGYLGSTPLFAAGVAGVIAAPLAVFPWRGSGKRRATQPAPPPVAATAPMPALVDEDTVQIPRVRVAKLLDPDTETTLNVALPRQRTAWSPTHEGSAR
ncbi:glycosyltransferase family 2 protein [Streptomyces spinosirectus]|jgi:cellulose synthase/poly-beta-1,6-N-acetylglucosamine synthase-like glycosyltransferase|uniref:glycosyltransferase n=1 Tax=Streptomyces TaxID=1883 RepID=UPI001C9D803B|nr:MULTISPECIES: glycosyltransferase family 2 protein [Streptomyces]MBY8341970.1 glycosyltransferase family 2 protein [Streptomyces plumbidurans]UIR16681.1 glycosyltransferase family 2 protein [Streptomyces spinosirectus]